MNLDFLPAGPRDSAGPSEGWARPVRSAYWIFLSLVVVSAYGPYREIPSYWFTKTETGAAVLSSRIGSFRDFVELLTSPVLSAVRESPVYYRPTYTFSFSLDYAVWGLDPFGYHLTDLLLHLGVAILLFHVVYRLNDREVWSAGLAGLIYTLHPVTVEVVPAVNHRQESLMAFFLLAGLLCFFTGVERRRGVGWMLGSMGCFTLAMGAKESGVFFVLLVVGYLWLREGKSPDGALARLRGTVVRSGPYLLLAGLYVGWWFYVTRARALYEGGGFARGIFRGSMVQTVNRVVYFHPPAVVPTYLRAVFYPFGSLWQWMDVRTAGAILLLVLAAAWLWDGFRQGRLRGAGWGLRSGILLLLAAMVCFPFYEPLLEEAVARAYRGEGFSWLRDMMDSRHRFSVSDYQGMARFRLLGLMGACLGVLAVIYGFVGSRREEDRLSRGLGVLLEPRGACLFYLWWLVTPAVFFTTVGVMDFKHAYHGLAPLAALTGTLTAGSGRTVVRFLGERFGRVRGTKLLDRWRGVTAATAVGILLLYLAGLVSVSPAKVEYSAWNHTQRNLGLYYRALFRELDDLPPHSEVRLPGVPKFSGQKEPFPHLSYMALSMNPRPWVRLKFPDRRFRVDSWSFLYISDEGPDAFHLDRRQLGSHFYVLETRRSDEPTGTRVSGRRRSLRENP